MWNHSKARAGPGTAGNPQNTQVGVPEAVFVAFGWQHPTTSVENVTPGFSGATVWKVISRNQSYALKRWPAGQPVHLELSSVHRLMTQARQAGLNAIPEVCRTRMNETMFSHAGTLWDACAWQPGHPDPQPSESRLKSAVELLRNLHAIWRSGNQQRVDVCPAVALQHRRLLEWTTAELDQLKQLVPMTGLYREATTLFEQHRPQALQRLASWLHRRVSLHPCLGDVWAEHVLFEADQVTGLIDFGGVRYDHPAQDLARLIGSYTLGDAVRRQFALNQYSPLTPETEQLTILLDDCGTIVGLGNWLRWLVLENRVFADQPKAAGRLQLLVNRLSRRSDPE